MKKTGIVRRVDELGRFVIPKEIRRGLNISNNDPLEIYVENDGVFLKKYGGDSCVLCGNTSTHSFNEKNICQSCLDAIINNKGVVKNADN